jgi:hypothetical protein
MSNIIRFPDKHREVLIEVIEIGRLRPAGGPGSRKARKLGHEKWEEVYETFGVVLRVGDEQPNGRVLMKRGESWRDSRSSSAREALRVVKARRRGEVA